MKKFLPLLLVILAACGTQPRQAAEESIETASKFDSQIHQAFVNNLASLCGQTFLGEQVYRSHHGASWADKKLVMHVTVCEEDKVFIPFHLDDDHSRTWMFVAEDGKLRFKHQHLHEDGTPEEGSMYGGYADDRGTAFVQYFPADEYTGQVIEGGAGNVWIVSLAEDLSSYSYRLDRDGEKRLEIRFDLTQPVSE
ncbi:MAG: hypothetical protein K0B09_14090 [Bacteroidales bacterium]|nr:hypothetical protein [Bacteroidales bacterium]